MTWIMSLIALIAAFILYRIIRSFFQRVIVYQYEKGLKFRKGKLAGVLGPGSHWHRAAVSSVVKYDMRSRIAVIPGQEVLSKDGVGLKVSIVARFKIADPEQVHLTTESYMDALHTFVQIALREIVGVADIDTLLENRAGFNKQLMTLTGPQAGSLGLVLESVEIRDIMFPGELKQVFANTVKARKEGLAALERARGESAALRHLANAARLIDNNPNLLQLRILQAVGESKGNTIVLGMPGGKTMVPVKPQPGNDPASE